MNITIQTGNLAALKEALTSDIQKVRFGSEFCMYALPTIDALETAYKLTSDAGKEFVYVTPRLAESSMNSICEHLHLLNELGEVTIVANDLGTVQNLKGLSNLKLHLGRQVVYTPSRCPWKEITEHTVSIFTKRKVKQIFYQTALNYKPTIEFYKGLGAIGADVDMIPELFPAFDFLIKNKLNISVHLHSIPVTITRKCHMARFLGETDFERCSRPCYAKAYIMDNEKLDTQMVLSGNTVFKLIEPNQKMTQQLAKRGIAEVIFTVSPLTSFNPQTPSESLIQNMRV
jgi:hypothetical protein